ncbi:lytic transglycosylase domain-containing protein [Silvibacterium bohemicum]|nr:lytic transglycosylase domain-containing protein [Silvibacterium bohemicum]
MVGFGRKTRLLRRVFPVIALASLAIPCARAAEHITLANGFDLICDHRVADGSRVRLYMDDSNFVEVDAAEITESEHFDLPAIASAVPGSAAPQPMQESKLSDAELHELLAKPSAAHNLDVDLLASVVKQESGGQVRAISRTGAQGLMQLMPGTAAGLGVNDAFAPGQNVSGGTAYLDSLLKRYHDNLALALAAYNAGPGAVDRWHGIPPYRETRAYVARVIHEFNRRIAARGKTSAVNLASAVTPNR